MLNTVLAAAWVPFAAVSLLLLLFSFIYIRCYQHKFDKELCSTLTSIFGLAVVLIACAVVPVDITLVSYMKTPEGNFKPWADEKTRSLVQHAVLNAYYVLFSIMFGFIFLILPWAYFYYEEGDEDTSKTQRCGNAFKFSSVFLLVGVLIFLLGIFLPLGGSGSGSHNGTSSEWQLFVDSLEKVKRSKGENALAFMISVVSTLGMFLVIKYTAIGIAVWPLDLIKGRRNISREHLEVSEQHAETMGRVQAIRNRYNEGARMSARDRRSLNTLEDEQNLIERRQQRLEVAEQDRCSKVCTKLLRPFQIITGVFFLLLSVLVFISLLLTNIDKIMHSSAKTGYYMETQYLPNILDIIFVFSQQVFPLDYLFLILLLMLLVFSTIGAMSSLGIHCGCLKLFKIRYGRTRPQALLFLCFLLTFIVLALNVLLYQMMPQYFTYGSQHYRKVGEGVGVVPCNASSGDLCVMSRISFLLSKYFYSLWFFGAVYYWLSWVFLLVFVLALLVTIIRKRRSSIEGAVESEDLITSDDEPISP